MQVRFLLPTVITILAPSLTSQSQTASPVLIEATSVLSHNLGYCEKHLVLRLYSDGKVEWEDAGTMRDCKQSVKDKGSGLHSTRISVEQVAAMRHSIDNLDLESVSGKLGPYNRYVDTSIEFFVNVSTQSGTRKFSVANPWTRYPVKPLPEDLKVLICEISMVRSRVADEAINPPCK
jgi:hypothetical protein